MDVSFISERITELRLARNISEYQMSLELGKMKKDGLLDFYKSHFILKV